MLNNQPSEKLVNWPTNQLDVHSIFYTVQGEGPFTGFPSVFIRLAGCNLQCPKCDTAYTDGRVKMLPMSIIATVKTLHKAWESKSKGLVVITGGEPFRQHLTGLIEGLIHTGFTVQIETNGSLPLSNGLGKHCSESATPDLDNLCHIVVSPKVAKVQPSIEAQACAYKYVVSHKQVLEDGLPFIALDNFCKPHLARPHGLFKGPVYLQPCDDKDQALNALNLNVAIMSCMEHGYILQLQTHKLLGLE